MYAPITIPFGCKMLFNTVKLRHGVNMEDVEVALGEMCNVVKETYGGDKGGFIAGQVFQFSGFVSDEGSLSGAEPAESHIAIATYWRSFEEHEKSHADKTFNRAWSFNRPVNKTLSPTPCLPANAFKPASAGPLPTTTNCNSLPGLALTRRAKAFNKTSMLFS